MKRVIWTLLFFVGTLASTSQARAIVDSDQELCSCLEGRGFDANACDQLVEGALEQELGKTLDSENAGSIAPAKHKSK